MGEARDGIATLRPNLFVVGEVQVPPALGFAVGKPAGGAIKYQSVAPGNRITHRAVFRANTIVIERKFIPQADTVGASKAAPGATLGAANAVAAVGLFDVPEIAVVRMVFV
jgi:hypothetical protein